MLYLLILSTRSSGGVTESTGSPIDVDQRDTLPAGAQRVTVPAPHRCTSLRVADDADDGVPDLSDHVMHHSMLVVMVCSSMQHAMLYTITTSMEM